MVSITLRRALLCSGAAMLSYAPPAQADVSIDGDSKTALASSTSGNITIVEDATLDVDGATPLTLDSSQTITIEDGAEVTADAANGRVGILVAAGSSGTITNDGVLNVTEDFVPDDEDADAKPDGPVAEASGRTGILVNSTLGSIENAGSVYVEGLDSAGIRFADGWSGAFDNTGSISVVGDNSVAIATGDIATDFTIGGSATAVGQGAQVLVVDGDIDGRLVIDGTLTKASGYTNDDAASVTLSRSALRVAAPAVHLTGNVAGGILIAAPPLDLDDDDDDEDNDGVDDADETTGAIASYGESAAMVIGSADDIVIGAGATRDGTYSLGVDGTINAYGYYSAFDATALVIGGQGGTVDLAQGISVGGTVKATTSDSSALALVIEEGANVPRLYVSGQISAVISSTGEGAAVAVRDLSGTLTQIDNTGYITVTGASEDETLALDLAANTSGVTIRQYLNAVDAEAYADELEDYAEDEDSTYDPDNPTIYASMIGDIVTGSGNDLLDVATGQIKGNTYLSAGDDLVNLSGNARYIGTIHSGTGDFALTMSDTSKFAGTLDVAGEAATLTLSDSAYFSGTTQNAAQLAVQVDGGLFEAGADKTVAFDSLVVGSDGAIGVVVNTEDGTSSTFDVNSATFADGAAIAVSIGEVLDADGSYLVLTADTLAGADGLTLSTGELPILYSAELLTDLSSITVDVHRKTAGELGLNAPHTAAYEAILAAAAEDAYVQASILQSEDLPALQGQFDQLLPDYAGGVFDFITRSSRMSSRRLSDGIGIFDEWPVGIWLEPFYFRGSGESDQAAAYTNSGYGLSGGWEKKLGAHYVGLSASWAKGSVDTGDYQATDISKYEAALHWRMRSGKFYAFARAGYFRADMGAENSFTGTVDDADFTYASTGDWSGSGYTGMLGGSYDVDLSQRLTLRPKLVLDHFRLDEKGYETTADSDAIALTVASRSSDATTVTPSLVASYRLQNEAPSEQPMTVEFEAGYRAIAAGTLGSVTANFEDGDPFTLTPGGLEGGWTAEARLLSGAWDHSWQIAAGAEQTGGEIDLSTRIQLNVAF